MRKIIISNLLIMMLFGLNTVVLASNQSRGGGDDSESRNVLRTSFLDALNEFENARVEFIEAQEKIRMQPQSIIQEVLPQPIQITEPLRFGEERAAPFGAPAPINLDNPASRLPESPIPSEPERVKLLNKMADVFIEHHKNILEQIQKHKEIYNDAEKTLLPRTESRLEALRELKIDLSETHSREKLQTITRVIKDQRRLEEKIAIRKSMVAPHLNKFEEQTITTAELRKERIAEKIHELQNAGKDTASLKALLQEAELKIEAAKTDLGATKTEMGKPSLRSDLLNIRDQIKSAYQIFRDIAILGQSL